MNVFKYENAVKRNVMQAVSIGCTLNCKAVNVLMINISPEHGDVYGNGNTVSCIRNLGITCTCVFSFTPWPIYSRGINRRYQLHVDTRWRSWLPHCVTLRKVTGSILNGAIGILHRLNPSGRTMPLGSTQPMTETSMRITYWG